MKKGVKIGFSIVSILIVIAMFAVTIGKNVRNSFKSADTPEMRVEKTYTELSANDYATETEYVQFAAFFVRDLDGDGYVERLDGTCRNVNTKDNLYIELNVLTKGYLEDGLITINTDNNFSWNTSMIADTMIAKTYVGDTSTIELKSKIQNGNQKLMWGKISPKLNNNINNYSKVNSITLTGTHVVENDDGTETRTEINITRNVNVDWYGETVTDLNVTPETHYLSELQKDNQTVVNFTVQASEENLGLILQKQELKINVSDLNGFNAVSATCTDSGVVSEYDAETKVLTVTRSSEVDENGEITKAVARQNRFNIKITYPKDAYDSIEGDTIGLSYPVTAYNYGYNNDSKIGEENVFDNPYVSEKSKVKNVSYVKKQEDTNGYIWNLTTTIGERRYNRIYGRTIKEISKKSVQDIYNGNAVTEDDEYPVTWKVDIGMASAIDKIVLDEKTENNQTGCDSFNGTIDMRNYSTIKNITFRNFSFVLGNSGWIKIYDADIEDEDEALLKTITAANWNSVHELNVKTIRIETSKPIASNTSLYIDLTKVLDDQQIAADYTEEEFADLGSVYTYLSGTITAPNGVQYSNGTGTSSLESRDYAYYLGGYSVVTFGNSRNNISSQKTENIEFTIRTEAVHELEEPWTNSIFLIELPEEIVKAKVNDVISSNSNVEVKDFYAYRENGKYFIKVYTQNNDGELFTLSVDADITANPLIRTTTAYIKLYGYNNLCDNYYMDGTDLYDVDEDELVTDDVAVRSVSLTIKNIGSSGLNTTEYITNYDDDSESVTVAPNIADIEKSDNARTARVNVNIMNNFDGTLSEIAILGRIPYENNKYVLNQEDMGSGFTAQITGPIVLPETLENYATVYYSTNGLATKDLTDLSNSWKTEDSITDWSNIKSYLIDLGEYTLTQDSTETLYYTVEVPAGLGYNSVSFSHHAVYYCLDTETGKLATQTEPNKVGIQVVGKYSLEIDKYLKGNRSVIVPGVSFILSTLDANGDPLVQIAKTDRNGNLRFDNLYVEREYTLKEQSVPSDYALLDKEIKFKARVGNNGEVILEMLQDTEANFAETPQIVLGQDGYYVVKTIIENEPKYNLQLTKTKKNISGLSVQNAIYKIETQDHTGKNITITGRTDENGVVTFSGLYLNEHCVLTEVNSPNDYILSENEIGFIGKLNEDGYLSLDLDDGSAFKGSILIDANPSTYIQTAHVKLEDEAKVKLKLTKLNEEQEKLEGVRFTLSSSKGAYTLITDSNGEANVSGLYTDVEYTLKEKEADGYYLAEDKKFTITRDNNGDLIVSSTDTEFATALINEYDNENQNLIEVTIENERIPKYTLNLLKVEEDFEEENIANLTPLEGARYKITSLDTGAEYSVSTNEQGIGTLTDLYQYIQGKNATGKYILKEVEAPSGYVLNPEEIIFSVKNNNGNLEVIVENKDDVGTYKTAVVDGTTVTLVVQDKAFFKLNKIDSETGLPLANAEFVIYSVDENGKEIDFAKDDKGNYIGTLNEYGYYVVTSDANGVITLPLTNGLYKAVEVTYPEGYMEEVTEEFFRITDGKEEEEEETQTPTETLQTLEISYIEDLTEFAQNVKNGNNYENYQVLLMNDLDFESASSYRSGVVDTSLTKAGGEAGFIGIGEYNKPFSGIFDGQNHTINNLFINKQINSNTYYYQNNAGLFEYVKGTIKNLTVTGEVSTTKAETGYSYGSTTAGIVALTMENAVIDNCHNKANITNEEKSGNYSSGSGGVVGVTRGGTIVKNCTNEGTVINRSMQEYCHAGGIVANGGSSYITVINCHNSGTVKCEILESTSSSGIQIGGIYSFGGGEVINCSNTGEIICLNANSTCYVGGIVGDSSATVENCFNTANISITESTTKDNTISIYAGGMVGDCTNNKIIDCYNTGNITTALNSTNSYLDTVYLGGIIGQTGYAKRCYNTGNIEINYSGTYKISTGTYSTEKAKIGGIAGSGTCDNCYNTGNINCNFDVTITTTTEAELYAGGIAGFNSKAKNCYNTGNVKFNESSPYLKTNAGTILGDGTLAGTCGYLTSIQLAETPVVKGTAVSDSTLKSLEFYNYLNSDGEWKYNEGAYPTLVSSRETEVNAPTEVNYIEDLVDISDAIYNGYKYNGATIKLKRSLDFNNDSSYKDPTDTSYGDINRNGIVEPIETELTTGNGFKPIGITDRVCLDADFDGKGNEIQNLYINDNESAYVGLFGYTKGTIKNLGVSGQIIVDPGTINGSNSIYIGGIAAYTTKTENCNSNVNIKLLESTNRAYIGGVVGSAGTVINCNNSGKIISYATYTNTSSYYSYDCAIGGVAGTATNVSRSSNKGSITTVKGYTGGIVGQGASNGTVRECYNLADISGSQNIGGIVGRSPVSGSMTAIKNCYNTGNVFGDKYVAGIYGYGYSIGSISNVYNTGSISATEYVGAITSGGTPTTNDGYYLDTISVAGRYVNERGEAVTDEKLKSDYIYNTLNEDNVWQQRSNAYPVLIKSVPENLSNATEITINNTLKKFVITTAVKDNIGGTITGDGEDPFETVIYKEDNTKAIVMQPAPGYGITKITINGKNFDYELENLDDSFTFPSGYFSEMTEDKHIVVTYRLLDQILTINKTNTDNEPLKDAEFNVSRNIIDDMVKNPKQYHVVRDKTQKIDTSTIVANGTYYFDKVPNYDRYKSNAVNNSVANSYIEIDLTEKTGYYCASFTFWAKNCRVLARLVEDNNIYDPDDANGIVLDFTSTSTASSSGKSATLYLECGKKYYLHFTHINEKGSNSEAYVESLEIDPVTFDEYWFEKQGDSYVSNNQGQDSTYAYSYVPIDLTSINGTVDLTVNAEISSESSADYGFAHVSTNITQTYESSTYGRLFSISGNVAAQDYKTTLNGGLIYYLNFGYYKNGNTSSGSDALKINSVTISIDGVTTNAYGIGNIALQPGSYTVTETKAPEGYTLNNVPQTVEVGTGLANKVSFTNVRQTGVTVHHYYKNSNGEYTTIKVADDESYLGDIGKEYSTAPINDLEGLTIEKDGTGNYVLPINAVGVYTEDGVVVNYYYESAPIKLTINHYIEGTETKLAEEKVELTPSTINQLANGYEVVANGEYDISENSDYAQIVSGQYVLTNVASSANGEVTFEDVLQYTQDSTLNYYYSLKQYDITTEVKPHTENRTNELTGEKENVQVDGGTIKLQDDSEIETVYHGENSVNPIIIEPDTNYTVKTITLESTDENDQTTTTVVYGEGEDANSEISYTVNQDGTITISNFENVIENKKVIVEFAPLSGTVIVHYYYEGTGEEYGNEAVKVDLTNGNKAENLELSDLVGEPYTATQRTDIESYYTLVSISGEPTGNYINGTTNIYYYYTYANYEYTIEHYYENLAGNYVIDDDNTVKDFAPYLSERALQESDKKVKTGYTYESQVGAPLTISTDSEENIIKLYYGLNSYDYTVKYLEKDNDTNDSNNTVLESPKTVEDIPYGTQITSSTEIIPIDGYNYDSLTPETLTISATNGENVINIYYTKKNDLQYTVNYLEKDTNTVLHTAKTVGGQTYLDTVTSSTEIIPIDGYNYDSLTPETLTISATNSENVINIYYTKRDDLSYKVKYLEKDNDTDDSNNEVLHDEKTESNIVFGTIISSNNEVIDITGYDFDSADKTSLTVGTTAANNVITLYYTKGTFGYEVHYFYDGVEDTTEKETATATYKDIITYQDVIDNFGDKVREGYALSDYSPKNTNGDLALEISATPENNVINIYYRTQYKVEAEVIEHTETTKDGTTTNVTGGTIYEGTNTPYETENVFKGDDSEKSIIIVPNTGYEIVNITVTDSTGTTTLDLDEVVANNGTATLNKDNGFFTNVNSNKKVEVEFRKQTTVIVKYLSATETDDNGNPLVLATEETITGYETKEFTTGRKPVTYYQTSSKGITDENDTNITEYDRVSLDTNGNAEGTMYADTLTIIYWYERIPAGIVVRHIAITEADKKAGLDMESGTELESELLNGFVSLEETTYRHEYDKYISADGPESDDEDLIIVAKEENSKSAIYKAVVDGVVIGLEFAEYDPTDYVVEIRYYYIKQYTLSTEVRTHSENGEEVKGGTITEEENDVVEIINQLGENTKEIVITPDYGYRVGSIVINDEEIDLTTIEEDENHVIRLPEGYFANVDEDIIVSVEFEKIPAKVITRFVDVDTGEEIEEEVIQDGFVKDPYTTESKEIDTYVLEEDKTENPEGVMVEEDTIVTYYYKKQFKITTDVIEHEEIKYTLIEIPKEGKQDFEIINVKGGSISGEDEAPYEIVPRGENSKKAIILKPDENYIITSIRINGEEIEIENEDGYTLAQFEDIQKDIHIEVKYEKIPSSIKVEYIDEETGESIAETDIQAGNIDSPYQTEPKDIEGYKLVKVDGNKAGKLSKGGNTVTYYYKKVEDLTIFEKGAGMAEEAINGVTSTVRRTIYNAKTGDPIAQTIIGFVISMFIVVGIEVKKVVIRRKNKGEEEKNKNF